MARRGPPAGSRAEAVTLARRMLSAQCLPAGARRLPLEPVPGPVREPGLWGGAAAAVDLYELFELPQPVNAVAHALVARMPVGMSREASIGELATPPGVMGREAGVTSGEAAYLARSVPPGVDMAQLVVTVAPVRLVPCTSRV
jgi:hypothetical protein